MSDHTVHTVRIEPLTAGAYAPFGEVLAGTDRPLMKQLPEADEWRSQFEVDGNPELIFVRFKYAPWEFSVMERHVNVTESYMPLGGKPLIMVVAPPTALDDWDAVPSPDKVRAFVTDGTQAILNWKGTWHAVHRYPVYPPHVDAVVVSGLETGEDLLAAGDATGKAFMGVTPGQLTQRVDYRDRFATSFELAW